LVDDTILANVTHNQTLIMITNKVFVIGLPRTATTSLCEATLALGFATAHTAYTNNTFDNAQVIADTPMFCDYQYFDQQYPNAKFIYLERPLALWLPSIRQLLERMFHNLQRQDGGSNPMLRHCFNQVFHPLTLDNIASDEFLSNCYARHQNQVLSYFDNRPLDLLSIDVAQADSYQQLCQFLHVESIPQGFSHINKGGKVTAWKQIKSPLKIESTNKGKIERVLKGKKY